MANCKNIQIMHAKSSNNSHRKTQVDLPCHTPLVGNEQPQGEKDRFSGSLPTIGTVYRWGQPLSAKQVFAATSIPVPL